MPTRLPIVSSSLKRCSGWMLEKMLRLCSLPRCVPAEVQMPAQARQPRLMHQQSPQLPLLPLLGGASALSNSARLPSLGVALPKALN